MHPTEYFGSTTGRPERGTRPVPSDWLPWAEVELERGPVQLLDLLGDQPLHRIRLKPGVYQACLRGYDYAGLRLVAGFRLLHSEVSRAERKQGGELLPIESAQLGVTAPSWSIRRWSLGHGSEMPFGQRERCLFVQTGLGDGTYSLYHLVADGRSVGLEAEFLLPHLGYAEMEHQPRALAYYELERIVQDLQNEPQPGELPAQRKWQLELLFQKAADAFRARDYQLVVSLLTKASAEELDRTARARLEYARKKLLA